MFKASGLKKKNTKTDFDDSPDAEYRFGMTGDTNLFRTLRLAAKLTQAKLAKLVGTSQAQIGRLEKNERELTKPWAERIAPHLNTTVERLLKLDSYVPIAGYVGAGGCAYYYDSPSDVGEAPRPPGFSRLGVALIVRGDSMPAVAEDGWLIYYEKRSDPPTEDMIGELCVVGLECGSVMVKRVFRGGEPGTFDLVSTGLAPLKGRIILWAAKVDWIKPR